MEGAGEGALDACLMEVSRVATLCNECDVQLHEGVFKAVGQVRCVVSPCTAAAAPLRVQTNPLPRYHGGVEVVSCARSRRGHGVVRQRWHCFIGCVCVRTL